MIISLRTHQLFRRVLLTRCACPMERCQISTGAKYISLKSVHVLTNHKGLSGHVQIASEKPQLCHTRGIRTDRRTNENWWKDWVHTIKLGTIVSVITFVYLYWHVSTGRLKKETMGRWSIIDIFIPFVPLVRRYWNRLNKDFVELPKFAVKDITNFIGRSDDIWVVSFPRSGTTWLQEIIYLIQTGDFDTAQSVTLDDRFPYLEFTYPGPEEIETMKSPRFIKTHLPWTLIPNSVKRHSPKFIYIARNPKDVVVSYYYYSKLMFPVTRFDGSFKYFFDLFVENEVPYTPWCKHVLDFWNLRQEENILYITYEDLKKDTSGTIDKIASFLGKDLTADQKSRIMSHCSFTRMKDNQMTNHSWLASLGVSDPNGGEFLRKGSIGDWNNHFDADMNITIDRMVWKGFAGSNINFSYEGTHFAPSCEQARDSDGKER